MTDIDAATYWLGWIHVAKVTGAFLVAIGVAAEFLGDWIAKPYEDVVEDSRKAQFAKLSTDLGNAQTETAKANKATEELRRQNLELEKYAAPRTWIIEGPPDANPLKKFAPKTVFIAAIPDFEANRLANSLAAALKIENWDARRFVPDEKQPLFDGVKIEYRGGVKRAEQPDPSKPGPLILDEQGHTTWYPDQYRQAAEALLAEFARNRIEAKAQVGWEWPQGVPDDALIVLIGAKPSTYFVEERIPWLKEMRERMERSQAEMDKRHQQEREKMEKRPDEPK